MTIRSYAAGPHTTALWESVSGTLADIESLTFLDELGSGSLDGRAFANYILQDEIYLAGYAQAMSLLAAKAPNQDEARFWALAAGDAVAMEQSMHADLLADDRFAGHVAELTGGGEPEPSPTTLGYVSTLIATAATAPYEVGVAAVLPCFWVYAHIGKVLVARAGDLGANPYRVWVEAYDSEEFDGSVDAAVEVCERAAAGTTEAVRAQMATAFARATVYELRFWATAAAFESWDLDEL